MKTLDYRKYLNDAITSLKRADDQGQLAYLALSSKCEHAVRDRMALLIRSDLAGKVRVARELTLADERHAGNSALAEFETSKEHRKKGGIDLAVLDQQGRKVLSTLEIKQIYGFDFIKRNDALDSRELEKLRWDIQLQRLSAKVFNLKPINCPVLLLAFDAVPKNPDGTFPPTSRVLKYPKGHEKRFKFVTDDWATKADRFLSTSGGFWNGDTGTGTSERIATKLDCGSAEGFRVTLEAWLLQPK